MYTGAEKNTIVYEVKAPSDTEFKALKRSMTRNSKSASACYIEVYIDKQNFSGGNIKSWFVSEFFARSFRATNLTTKSSKEYNHTRYVRLTDEPSREAAKTVFREAFLINVQRFLSKLNA